MIANKQFPSGAWEISEIVNGVRVARIYFGYTKKEAAQRFRDELKKEKGKK